MVFCPCSHTAVATQEMERLLKEKDHEMVKMAQQLRQFKKVARDLTKIVDHSKGQSRLLVDLKQQLQKAEVNSTVVIQ